MLVCRRIPFSLKEEIDSFCRQNRQFRVVGNMEIENALENDETEKAIVFLIESKTLDSNNKALVEKYSWKLIGLYKNNEKTTEKVLSNFCGRWDVS